MEPVSGDGRPGCSRKLDAAPATGEHVVSADQESAKILCVDGISLIPRADQVVGDPRRLPHAPQFNATAALGHEVVVDAGGVGMIRNDAVLQIHQAHSRDTERVIGAGDMDAGLAVAVGILGLAPRALREMQTVDAEVGEFDGADARIAGALDMSV